MGIRTHTFRQLLLEGFLGVALGCSHAKRVGGSRVKNEKRKHVKSILFV